MFYNLMIKFQSSMGLYPGTVIFRSLLLLFVASFSPLHKTGSPEEARVGRKPLPQLAKVFSAAEQTLVMRKILGVFYTDIVSFPLSEP